MRKKIAFIINPKSGVQNKNRIPDLIRGKLNTSIFEPEIVFTERSGHATELARDFIHKNFDCIVAVGGDGTVHEVAYAVRDTDVALGIIPTGSGNGLARHLGISINVKKAIKQLNTAEVASIDYCLMNGTPFFCTCGIGFDAYISLEFDKVKIRGIFGYLRKTVVGFFKYKSQYYQLTYEDKNFESKAFLITLANAAQWGYNAYIAPTASVKDGLLNITVLRRVHFFSTSWLAIKLFTKTLNNSKHIKTIRTKEITIRCSDDMLFHLDGDPFGKGTLVHVKTVPDGLKVICPTNFQ